MTILSSQEMVLEDVSQCEHPRFNEDEANTNSLLNQQSGIVAEFSTECTVVWHMSQNQLQDGISNVVRQILPDYYIRNHCTNEPDDRQNEQTQFCCELQRSETRS